MQNIFLDTNKDVLNNYNQFEAAIKTYLRNASISGVTPGHNNTQ